MGGYHHRRWSGDGSGSRLAKRKGLFCHKTSKAGVIHRLPSGRFNWAKVKAKPACVWIWQPLARNLIYLMVRWVYAFDFLLDNTVVISCVAFWSRDGLVTSG